MDENGEDRRPVWERAGLAPEVLEGIFAWGRAGKLPALAEQMRAVGGCARPVHLAGAVRRFDTGSGELVSEVPTPGGAVGSLLVACGSRHESVCPSCARVYAGDTWHLIHAGLVGGKGRAAGVRWHPRVFLTLTAPGFGVVHTRREPTGAAGTRLRCRPRRDRPVCAHGRAAWCDRRHEDGDRVVGTPLCVECFDYPGTVLWNAHAGALWSRWSVRVGRELGRLTGRDRAAVRAAVKVEAHRIAELQLRGAVHFHAVVRADSGTDPDRPPPDWVTGDLLAAATLSAARRVVMRTPVNPVGEWELRFGTEMDASVITAGGTDEQARQIASYLAKYLTKDAAAGLARRIGAPGEIPLLPVPGHARALVAAAWQLGGVPGLEGLKLRRWAHQYGYRGPVATRSRGYSATLRALQQERIEYRRAQARARGHDRLTGSTGGRADTVTVLELAYRQMGLDPAASWLAAQVRADAEAAREAAREAADEAGNEAA